ncbi:TetR/AcrR family transcriptional regulator [Chelatococcus reniformis]|uniref:TetR family transcriptional regulator n=1 Tax=Chelatococcus reniformis TaxID=1494448 RepID=A0A916U413_9HYPH|nr:TetR/AcrR family transcriptional regulator [Chelatococcus reniformis]GGC59819.1 TetR family transcriptional regulator [Chelatococcus reniformis]
MTDDLFSLDLPGVTPSRQSRSRETMEALLKAGEQLLRTRHLEDLSIVDLTAEVGVTVGSFYGRFESKDAYFNALQVIAIRRGQARYVALRASGALAQTDLAELCRLLAEHAAGWFREHEGVARAALRHSSRPERWSAFKELGRVFVVVSTPDMLARLGPGRRAAKTRTVGFAFQAMFGILVNIVLNDPGPCGLDDADLVPRLAALVEAIVRVEADGAAPDGRGRSPRARRAAKA